VSCSKAPGRKRLSGLRGPLQELDPRAGGVGFEAFASKEYLVAVDAGYRCGRYTDGGNGGKLKGYATAKVGVNFYLGHSTSEKEDAIARAKAQRREGPGRGRSAETEGPGRGGGAKGEGAGRCRGATD